MASELEYKSIASAKVSPSGRWRVKSATAETRTRVDRKTEWDCSSLPGQLWLAAGGEGVKEGRGDDQEREMQMVDAAGRSNDELLAQSSGEVTNNASQSMATSILQPQNSLEIPQHPQSPVASADTLTHLVTGNDECAQFQLHTGTSTQASVFTSNYGCDDGSFTASKHSLADHSLQLLEMNTDSAQRIHTPPPSSAVQNSSTLFLIGNDLPSLPAKREAHERGNSTSPSTLLSLICVLLVYPILMIWLPLLITLKLFLLLCCCVPCLQCGATRHLSSSSRFFKGTEKGGYYFTLVELNERMTYERFSQSILSSMSAAGHESESILSLHSRIKHCASCFSWLESSREIDSSQHITIVQNQVSTNNDITYFIFKLSSSSQANNKTSLVYFFAKYKHKSAVLIQTHHSLLTGQELRKKLIELFAHSRPLAFEQTYTSTSEIPYDRPTAASLIFRAPGIVLKHLLRPSSCLGTPFGKMRFAFSKEVSLAHVYSIARNYSCSLDVLLLVCLAGALRSYMKDREISDITFAIPSSIGANMSAYFIQLPVNRMAQSFAANVEILQEQVSLNRDDIFALHSAGKLGSAVLPQCILNSLTRSVLKQAGGVFTVVDCSRDPLYFDGVGVSSVAVWPPLFAQFAVGVSIVCYGSALRVCVATDRLLCEWPDVIVSMLLSELESITAY